MAVLTVDQIRKVYTDDRPRRWGLFALLNVTSADTADMSALGFYRKVSQSMIMGCTVTGTVAATQTGATITLPAGLAGDSAYMLVDGIPV